MNHGMSIVDKRVKCTRNGTRERKVPTSEKQNKRPKMQNTAIGLAEITKLLEKHEAPASDTCADTSTSVQMALNVVLDHSAFQKTLLQHDLSRTIEDNIVPVISRVYEESYMREHMFSADVHCCLNEYCECSFIDREHPFVGVAFAWARCIRNKNVYSLPEKTDTDAILPSHGCWV